MVQIRFSKRCFFCCLFVAIAAIPPVACGDDRVRLGYVNEAAFIEPDVLKRMWQLKLFGMAIAHCKHQQSLQSPGSDAYAHWTMWLIESLGQQAANIHEQRATSLEELDRATEHFREDKRNERRWLWIEWKWQVARLAVANAELANYLAAPARADSREQALGLARDVLDACDRWRPELDRLLALSASPSRDRERVPAANEAQTLYNEWLLLKADALWTRTQAYPRGDSNVIAYGAEMLAAIEDADHRIALDWIGRPRLELYRCTALVFAQRLEEAQKRLEALVKLPLTPDLLATVQAKRIECFRLQGNLEQAKQLLQSSDRDLSNPNLELERIELAFASAESSDGLAAVLHIRDQIGERFGDYWRLRAEAVIAGRTAHDRSAATTRVATAIDLIFVEVSQCLAANRIEEAIDKLIKAEWLAQEQNDSRALSVGYQIASLLQKLQRWEQASEKFASVSVRHSNHPQASSGHAMAIWLTQDQISRSESFTQEGKQKLRSLLETQIATWPADDHATKARHDLDRLLLSQGDVESAARLWLKALVLPETADAKVLERALARLSLLAMLLRCESPTPPVISITNEVRVALDACENAEHSRPKALGVALQRLIPEFVRDDRWFSVDGGRVLLDPSLLTSTPATTDLQTLLRDIGKLDDAESEEQTKRSIDRLTLLDRLLRSARRGTQPDEADLQHLEHLTSDQREPHCLLELAVIDQISGLVLDGTASLRQRWLPVLQQLVKRYSANAAAVGGHSGAILKVRLTILDAVLQLHEKAELGRNPFASLDSKSPRNQFLLFNGCLVVRDFEPDQAISQLQRLAAGLPANSPWWWEMRLRTAQFYVESGKQSDAAVLLDFLLATHPDPPSAWSPRLKKLRSMSTR